MEKDEHPACSTFGQAGDCWRRFLWRVSLELGAVFISTLQRNSTLAISGIVFSQSFPKQVIQRATNCHVAHVGLEPTSFVS